MRSNRNLIGNNKKKIFYIIFTCVLVILNVIRIFENNYWGDECFSIKMAQLPLGEMLQVTSEDVHPPLYYLILMLCYRILGHHAWLYHFVSLIPYFITVLFILTVIRKQFGDLPALLMLTFTSLSNNAVMYNIEARSFSLAAMMILFAYYFLYRIALGSSKAIYPFVLFSLGAAYSHYYAMMSVSIFYIAILIAWIRKKINFSVFIKICILTFIGYLPWMYIMVRAYLRTAGGYWITDYPDWYTCIKFFYNPYPRFAFFSVILFALTCFCPVYLVIRKKRLHASDQSDAFIWWICWGIVATIGTVAIGEFISWAIQPAFLERYLYPVSQVFWLVLSVSIVKLKNGNKFAKVLLFVCIVVYGACYVRAYTYERAQDLECSRTVKLLHEKMEKNDVILTDNSHLEWTILGYYFPENNSKLIEEWPTNLEEGDQYWLFLNQNISDERIEWLSGQGYEADWIDQGQLGTNEIQIYKVTRVLK